MIRNKIFKNQASLDIFLESACNKAVEKTCYRLLGTLQQIIDSEYYDQFEPDFYTRTYVFWKSATIKMLNLNCGEIFMDESTMDYGAYWNGEIQLQFASRGFHGSTEIQTKGRFWDSFVEFCENNAINILKSELRKQGITIK